jgi:hypothetical protein
VDEYYLKEYFGDKIRFGKGFFAKNHWQKLKPLLKYS